MKTLRVFLLFLAFFSNSVWANQDIVGEDAPKWTLTNLQGQSKSFPDDYQSGPTVILFWATWCPYCSALMPYLDKIPQEYPDADVSVLALNFKEDGDPKTYIKEKGYGFEVFQNADAVAQEFGVRFSPGLYVIDSEGKVVYQRRSTDQRPGKKIAEIWFHQVRESLNRVLGF